MEKKTETETETEINSKSKSKSKNKTETETITIINSNSNSKTKKKSPKPQRICESILKDLVELVNLGIAREKRVLCDHFREDAAHAPHVGLHGVLLLRRQNGERN
jgi:hypothetical protein